MENITSHVNSSILIDQNCIANLENSALQISDIDMFDWNSDLDWEMWRMSESYDGLLFKGAEEYWRDNSGLLQEKEEASNLQSFLSDYTNSVFAKNINEGDSAPLQKSQGSYMKQNGWVETKANSVTKYEEEETKAKEGEQVIGFIVKSKVDVLDDGYSWRKYGEKNIKRRIYPRKYYRCGHYGCKTLKRVERSTEESSELLITYYGRHSHHPYH